jgi:hypothetical protein
MGLPMHWPDKGKRSRPKLATASKDVNGRTPNTIVYADFEAAFLTWLDQLDWSSVIDTADSEEILRCEERIGELKASIEADSRKIETIIDALIDLPSPALKARLRTTETAVASHMSELSVTEAKLTEACQARAAGVMPVPRNPLLSSFLKSSRSSRPLHLRQPHKNSCSRGSL